MAGVKVALIWPGGIFGGEGNFGVPQLLSLAAALRREASASVDLYDLDAEARLGGFDGARFQRADYDVVAMSCYSSYDYLKVLALAAWLRPLARNAWFVVGGYHPSARPEDFGGETPFDFTVVGEGEAPLVRLVLGRAYGTAPTERVHVGTAADPRTTIPNPFELLERYRGAFDRVSRVELYLSRGCPYGCSFCMERSKRNVGWRCLSVDEAVEEIHRLDRFIGLRGRTLRIADALFGMNKQWRRDFLEALIRRPVTTDKIWLLTRADLLEREDFRLMARANLAPGFGLESGDPEVLRATGKLRGAVERFYDKLFDIAEWSREFGVPFGANVIVGLPGESQESLRRTADFLDRLFLSKPNTWGFFGIDRFRLYPGSGIAENFQDWHARTGCVVHRPRWWLDGDQDFLSEWIDPSAELDFESSMECCFELFAPRLVELGRRFAYDGVARQRFIGTIEDNLSSWSGEARQRQRELAELWRPLKSYSIEPMHAAAMTPTLS